jgi:hypothetical protein
MLRKNEPVYQALWVDNMDFDEVLISPVMIQDHMPDKVLEALEKVLVQEICRTSKFKSGKHIIAVFTHSFG